MAKTNEAKAPGASKGIGTRDWRGTTVYFCQTPGCVADSEVKRNIEVHVQRGKHRIQGGVVKVVKPRGQEVLTPVEDDTKDGD